MNKFEDLKGKILSNIENRGGINGRQVLYSR